MLVRQTHTRHTTGAFTWDICSGKYTMKDDSLAACTWERCYRRRRGAVERGGLFSIHDSGWAKRAKIPELYKEVDIRSGPWTKETAMFQEGDHILGIKLGGRGNCAEAIDLLAL